MFHTSVLFIERFHDRLFFHLRLRPTFQEASDHHQAYSLSLATISDNKAALFNFSNILFQFVMHSTTGESSAAFLPTNGADKRKYNSRDSNIKEGKTQQYATDQ